PVDFGIAQGGKHPIQLTDTQPANFIDELTKFRVGLSFESKSENLPHACCSCRAREDPRINAVAGDDGELIGRVQFRAKEARNAAGVLRAIAQGLFATMPEWQRLLPRYDLPSLRPVRGRLPYWPLPPRLPESPCTY